MNFLFQDVIFLFLMRGKHIMKKISKQLMNHVSGGQKPLFYSGPAWRERGCVLELLGQLFSSHQASVTDAPPATRKIEKS